MQLAPKSVVLAFCLRLLEWVIKRMWLTLAYNFGAIKWDRNRSDLDSSWCNSNRHRPQVKQPAQTAGQGAEQRSNRVHAVSFLRNSWVQIVPPSYRRQQVGP